MRRISLALALVGAVAATGCGGASAPTGSDGAKGTYGVDFTLTVNNQGPGTVTSSPAGIDCAANTKCTANFATGTAVILTATPTGTNYFNGWFGSCSGTGACTVTGNADQYVVSYFSAEPAAHPNFNDPKDHVSAWAAGVLRCDQCHGAALQGQGLAPACNACHLTGGHDWPIPAAAVANQALNGATGHFAASGHNSGACARCHASAGFRDFLGVDGTASNLADVKYAGGDYTAASGPVCDKNAVPPVTESCWNDPSTAGRLGTTAQWYYASGYRCDACHNGATVLGGGTLNTHKFPSGSVLTLDGQSAICAQCHDGGRPTYEVAQVKSYLTTAAATDLDAQLPSAQNKLVRAHYLPAASTLYGEEAGNWYEYAASCSKTNADGSPISTTAACTTAGGTWTAPGTVTAATARNNYTARNAHGGANSCTFCHDPHSGMLPYDDQVEAKCGGCHNDETTKLPVKSWFALEESRQYGFEGDIDGDLVEKPLNVELDGLRAKLLVAIRNYATNVAGADICFDGENRFYAGTGVNGVCTAAELTAAAAYTKFTPRLLPATYNYLIATNDKGAWAHNPRYAIEVMYDAIADLNSGLVAKGKTPSPNGNRAFNGHFGALEDPSKYAAIIYHGATNPTTKESLPAMGFTSGACYQCHGGAAGFQAYLAAAPAALTNTVITDASKISAFQCDVCHTYDGTDMQGIRSDVANVYFPPQKNGAAGQVVFAAADLPKSFAVCGTCHSGRENKATVDGKGLVAGTFNTTLVNPHYLGAAATVMGTRTRSWYEFDGKSYTANPVFWKVGTNGNAPGPHGSPHGAECTGCHQPRETAHEFGVDFAYCATCHAGPYALAPKEEEYASMKTELLAALDAYVNGAANVTAFQTANGADATGLCYDGAVYGYVLVKKATGCSATAAKLDLNAMRGAYNLHWMNKDPGGWAHNEYYVMQLVYDSIVALGGTPSFKVAAVTDATRVPVPGDPLNRGY